MINITLAQFKADIKQKMKGTSLNQVTDFEGTAAGAANRMLARIDPEETTRTATLASPFYDNVLDYVLATDYKGMIDIRPQANRVSQPGLSIYSETTPRQFLTRLSANSFSIRWNNMMRTLRAQVLPQGNCTQIDPFDSASSNGLWVASVDASGLYNEPLNYVEGNGSLGLNLSGATGIGKITNSTVPAALNLSAMLNEDASVIFVWIPLGSSSRITSIALSRGDSAAVYRTVTVATKADGTAFTDGWNMLLINWINGVNTGGTPTNLTNQYRQLTINYTVGAAITGFLVDNWTNALGQLYEMEYYSDCLYRTAAGAWINTPVNDTDLLNVGPASYEILKAEMMIDVTQIIRTGPVRAAELAEWRLMLNGQPQTRYVKDPPYHGLYADYLSKFPSSRIPTVTRTYDFDL